jgi:hypothetical protein
MLSTGFKILQEKEIGLSTNWSQLENINININNQPRKKYDVECNVNLQTSLKFFKNSGRYDATDTATINAKNGDSSPPIARGLRHLSRCLGPSGMLFFPQGRPGRWLQVVTSWGCRRRQWRQGKTERVVCRPI